jgi:hypothetical protein
MFNFKRLWMVLSSALTLGVAIAAAKRSVELNRFDPRNLAVLQAVTSAPAG